jgi:cytochrome c oxidase subunit 1
VVSTIGAYVIGISFVFLLVNLWVSWRKPIPAGDNPWDAHTLEWFATSPPVHHNFEKLPPIRSERPVWDYHHPDARTVHHGNGHGKVSGNGHGHLADAGVGTDSGDQA